MQLEAIGRTLRARDREASGSRRGFGRPAPTSPCTGIVPAGPPMRLSDTGSGRRGSLVLGRRAPWFLVLPFVVVSTGFAQPFHTSPACWKEPRFHHARPGVPDLRARVTLDRTNSPPPPEVVYSPNGAYAVHVKHPDRSQPGPWTAEVLVYTERDYLVRIRFRDVLQVDEPKWINEKLLFFRAWGGRIGGSDIIVDVERETVPYEEIFQWGGIAFEQFQQCRSEPWKEQELCKCYGRRE